MSEKSSLVQSTANQSQTLPQSPKKLNLPTALLILVIIYLVCETVPLYVTLVAPAAIPWIELGQWVLIAIWLIVGVRPPFMRWLKQAREA